MDLVAGRSAGLVFCWLTIVVIVVGRCVLFVLCFTVVTVVVDG